jgi:hypothetical protein
MGGSSKQTSTQTTEIPQEIRNRGSEITSQAMRQYMPSSYTPQNRNAATDPGYAQVKGQYGAADGSWNGAFGTAKTAATDAFNQNTAQRIDNPSYSTANVQEFMNPYRGDVIDATMARAQHEDQVSQSRLMNNSAGQFGNSRLGVVQAELAGENSRNRASLLSGLNQQGFESARDQFNTDFGQKLQANQQNNAAAGQNFGQGMTFADFMKNSGTEDLNNRLAVADRNLNLTNTQQTLAQQGIDRNVEESRYAQDYPLGIYERLQAMNAMQPVNRTSTSTTSQPSNAMGTAAYVAGSMLPMFMSDERVKEDVKDLSPEETLGAFAKIPSKTYRYKDELENAPKGERHGFMAQDYERAFNTKTPELADGTKHIDVPQLLGQLTVAVKGLEERTRKLKKRAA